MLRLKPLDSLYVSLCNKPSYIWIVLSRSTMSNSATPWTVVHQAPLPTRCSRQKHRGGLPFLPPGNPPDLGIKPASPALTGELFTTWASWEGFSSVTQSCPTLCDPIDCSTPGFPVHHQLPELTQTHVHCVGDTIQPSHPLLSLSLPVFNLFRHQGLF